MKNNKRTNKKHYGKTKTEDEQNFANRWVNCVRVHTHEE